MLKLCTHERQVFFVCREIFIKMKFFCFLFVKNEAGRKGRCENEADLSKFYINYFLFALFFAAAVVC